MKRRSMLRSRLVASSARPSGCWRRADNPRGGQGAGGLGEHVHRWRAQCGGMKADDVERLKELERENLQLKWIVANKELEIDAPKEIARGRMEVECLADFVSVPLLALPVGDVAWVGVLGLFGAGAFELAALFAVEAVARAAGRAGGSAGGELDFAQFLRGDGRH